MDKNQILEQSRAENHNRDLAADELNRHATGIGALVMIGLATVFFVLEAVIRHHVDFGMYAVVFSFSATTFIVRAARLRQRRDVLFAVAYTVVSLALIGLFLSQLFSAASV